VGLLALARGGQVGERQVPFTLEAMAEGLGWRKGGGAAAELARALDTLRSATFRARVYNARLGETHIDTFGLIDRWERGERHRPARPARPGFVVLGDWLHEQLVRGHVTYVSWAEMRALRGGTARRLLVYLDAERFGSRAWRRTIDGPLLTTLGIAAANPFHQRATLRRAAAEITRAENRYERVAVVLGQRRGEHVLTATRRLPRDPASRADQASPGRWNRAGRAMRKPGDPSIACRHDDDGAPGRAEPDQGSRCDVPGQSA
jgi:hypothetical protein